MAARKRLTEILVRRASPRAKRYLVWDSIQRGLALVVQPTGDRSFTCVYRRSGRPRWYHVGNAAAIGLEDARRIARGVMVAVAEGKDPAAERRAERGKGSFAELHEHYLAYVKHRNRSWRQADRLIKRNVITRWGKLRAEEISRHDVRALMTKLHNTPALANQVLAACSAVFSWAMREELLKVNPCTRIEVNRTRTRERVLADSEIAAFWEAFDDQGLLASAALKMILLTGQRPGEVRHLRTEHVRDGWWLMPGAPDPRLRWPGTKNGRGHQVYLSRPVRDLIELVGGSGQVLRRVAVDQAMRRVCDQLKVTEKVTPHDLRRTALTAIAAMGFGRQAMDRIANHADTSVGSVYDRHSYREEDQRIMDALADRVLSRSGSAAT